MPIGVVYEYERMVHAIRLYCVLRDHWHRTHRADSSAIHPFSTLSWCWLWWC
jgi:hypothetical protein